MDEEKELLDNIKEYVKEAEKSKQDGAYNSATTLYFKAIAVLIDLFILKKEGTTPTNHNERFKILKTKYQELYKILDKDFPIYQRSYRIKLTKEYLKILEDDFKKVIKFTDIKID